MKTRVKAVIVAVFMAFCLFGMTSCNEAETIKHNIQKEANKFDTYRKMTFVNLYTDKVLYTAEGYFSLKTTYSTEVLGQQEIALIFQIGKNDYKMDYFSIANNVAYVIEQIEDTHTDPYHWEIHFYIPLPSIN